MIMGRFLPIAACVGAALLASCAHTPQITECSGTDEACAVEKRLSKFQIQRIEDLAAAGETVRRVSTRNAFGHDYPIVTFRQNRNGDASVEVAAALLLSETDFHLETFGATITKDVFLNVLAKTPDLSIEPPDPKTAEALSLPICNDGAFATVEAADTGKVRTGHAVLCYGGPIWAYGEELLRIAVSALPRCAAIRPHGIGDRTRLDRCALSHGNIEAAGAVLSMAPGEIPFAVDATVEWAGKPLARGRSAAAALLAERLKARDHLEPTRIVGDSETQVTVDGVVQSFSQPDWQYALYRATWALEGGSFVCRHLEVTDFSPRIPAIRY